MNRPEVAHKYRLIAIDFFSDVGNKFIGLILLDLLVFKGASALSSLVMLCVIDQLPSVLMSPLAGIFIDRMGPKKWLVLVNLSKCVLVAAIAAAFSRWMFFPLYLCFIVTSLFFSIGRLSLVAMLVPKGALMEFNALNERIAIAGGILSPWLIGMMLGKADRMTALVLAGLFFLVTIFLTIGLPKIRQEHYLKADRNPLQTSDHLFFRARNAFGFSRYHLCHVHFLMLGVVLLGGGVLNLGLPFYFKTHLNGDISRWGVIMSAFQAGAFFATLLLPVCHNKLRQQAVTSLSFIVLGIAMFVLPYARSYLQVALLMAFLGCGFTMQHIFWESLIQAYSSRQMIGKSMSLLSAYRGLCYLVTVISGALISSVWGADIFIMAGSLVVGAGFLIPQKNINAATIARFRWVNK